MTLLLQVRVPDSEEGMGSREGMGEREEGMGSLLDFALRRTIFRTRSDQFFSTATTSEVGVVQRQATTPRLTLAHP